MISIDCMFVLLLVVDTVLCKENGDWVFCHASQCIPGPLVDGQMAPKCSPCKSGRITTSTYTTITDLLVKNPNQTPAILPHPQC